MTSRTLLICVCIAALTSLLSSRALAQDDLCVRFLSSQVECDPRVPGRAVITFQLANGSTFPVDRFFLWAQSPGLVLTPDEFIVPPIAPGSASGTLKLVLQGAAGTPEQQPCLDVSIHDSATGQCCVRTKVCPDLSSCRQGPVVRRADANLDSRQDISDAVKILGFLFLGDSATTCLDTMDSDDNAAIEITDAILLLTHLFLGGRPPAAPYPGCGTDPTADSLPCDEYPFCV